MPCVGHQWGISEAVQLTVDHHALDTCGMTVRPPSPRGCRGL